MKIIDYFNWFLLACCGFTASLSIYTADWLEEQPQLVAPLEQIRQSGRPISGALIAILILGILLISKKNARKALIPAPIIYLFLVQFALFAKNFLFGNVQVAVSTLGLYLLVLFMMLWGPSRWLQTQQDFCRGVWSIAMVGVIFAIANIYQFVIDRFPITFTNGYFMGTTGNPQHAAILLVAVLPCLLFLIESPRTASKKPLWLALLLLVCIGIVMTASRTGALAGVVAVLLFYRNRGDKFFRIAVVAGLLFLIGFLLLKDPSELITVSALDKATMDTRSMVWSEQIQQFLKYPFFGIPFQGDRLEFRESSWLGIAAATGLLGLLPLLMFGCSTIDMIVKLHRFSQRHPQYYLHCSTVVSGLGALLVGSFTEAYLLGVLTFTILALMQYLVLGQYLCELSQRTSQLQQRNPVSLKFFQSS